MNFIKKILGGVKKFFSSGKADEVLKTILDISDFVVPVIQYIAKMTPTRVDDEIIAIYKTYGLPNVEKYLSLPKEDRGAALLNAATQVTTRYFPGVPTNVIQTGINLAVTAMKVSEK